MGAPPGPRQGTGRRRSHEFARDGTPPRPPAAPAGLWPIFPASAGSAGVAAYPSAPSGSHASEAHFARLALRRLAEARERERHWRKSRSRQAAHRLRVALKRFRYSVESFLPEQQAAWGADLKRLQGLLGDVHDLDVLRRRILPMLRAEAARERDARAAGSARSSERATRRWKSYWRAVVSETGFSQSAGARPRTLWDRWEKKLTQLAGVHFPSFRRAFAVSSQTSIARGAEKLSISRQATPAFRSDGKRRACAHGVSDELVELRRVAEADDLAGLDLAQLFGQPREAWPRT